MRLLFIKLRHIGDALLLTPTLVATRRVIPEAEIWVATRRGTESILAGCTAIDRVVTTAAAERENRSVADIWRDFRLGFRLRRQRFDYAFELTHGDRGRILAWLSGARCRVADDCVYPLSWFWRGRFPQRSDTDWRRLHRVEADYAIVRTLLTSLPPDPPPLDFAALRAKPHGIPLNQGGFVILHPGTRWKRKRWPEGHWIELGRRLLDQVPQLVISGGPDPDEQEQARRIALALGHAVINASGLLSWPQFADLLRNAMLFVGVDTAAMHLAAACQCPSVAIFGPSDEALWRPWRAPHTVVSPPGLPSSERKTADVPVLDVWRACADLWRVRAEGALT